MITRWYRTGVFYSVDVGLFQDSNDDGVGDFRGLIARLDYLARLGITTIWLHPIHPSPRRDGGYDITDYFGVHPGSARWATSRCSCTRRASGASGSYWTSW